MNTAELIARILASRPHPQQGFRSCLGIMRLGKLHGPERLEKACRRALHLNTLSYKSVESILAHGLESQPLPEPAQPSIPIVHAHVRGPAYYQQDYETEGENVWS